MRLHAWRQNIKPIEGRKKVVIDVIRKKPIFLTHYYMHNGRVSANIQIIDQLSISFLTNSPYRKYFASSGILTF